MIPTIVLTRPKAQSAGIAAALEAAWDGPLNIIQSPLIEIVPMDFDPGDPDALIFTSVNGVAAAKAHAHLRRLTAWCVGTKTAQAAQAAGFDPVVGPGDAQGLIADIIAAKPTGMLAHIRGKYTRGAVCTKLNAAGLTCTEVIGYDQREQSLTAEAKSALNDKVPVLFPLFSPRTATILGAQAPFRSSIQIVALSDAVKEAAAEVGADQIVVADTMTAEAMKKAVLDLLGHTAARE